ncbi:Ig-like domain-containing protein [Ancylothrix sp. C2]|uniref:Ig-like domain-containing protein n=1 Tax=Ancylothrix sp. D3o TaxID=2953691 RepID=UPI0021BA4E32|nr:Ig-like domain-containing protein [Ancylothrix sp. D3o]MCT7949846.1 Ig-like domain-containing protein [Ancylothrix sp. D3o]
MSSSPIKFKEFLQPLDRAALAVMLVLGILIALLLLQGDQTVPRVRDFSWENKQIGGQERSFTLTFNRPMDRPSVEENLRIEPPLPGKISWAGRKMAYTLEQPAPYGTSYEVKLENAKDRLHKNAENQARIAPFSGTFRSRDRAFVYLGIEGKEAEKLMLVNLTQQQEPIILTPPDLGVIDFIPFPDGSRILFSARDISQGDQSALNAKIYTVTTGIHPTSPGEVEPKIEQPGKLDLILDNKDYQNLKFELSPDGKTIVAMRVNQKSPGRDFGLWMIQPPAPPKPMNIQGGEFLIHPDNQSIAITQGQGVAILPLDAAKTDTKPLDFLPKFGRLLNFSHDGASAAMVKFNDDYTRSLFWATNQGNQIEVFRTTGSIISAQFAPNNKNLYCLLTQLLTNGQDYREEPYLAKVELKSNAIPQALVSLPKQREVDVSLSADGLALLFDLVVTDRQNQIAEGPRTNSGETIITSNLMLLPLLPEDSEGQKALKPEELPFTGLRPRWLP